MAQLTLEEYMVLNRKPTVQEEQLLEYLVLRSSFPISMDWKNGLTVCPMDDGGMGSLLLFPNGKFVEDRFFWQQVGELQFTDKDGIEIIVSLNIDKQGNLFELDVWKTNFEKIIRIPYLK